jgi:hypothetical protein
MTKPTSEQVTFLAAGAGATQRNLVDKVREVVSVKDFGAVGDGVADDAAAIQAAVDASAGRPVYLPTGTYRINSTINYVTTSSSVFTPGLKLFGDGSDKTIIDTRVSNGPAINVDTSASTKFQLYASIEGLSIETNGTPSVASGIVLRKAYMVTIQDVWVYGLSGDGIQITMNAGDADGSNMVELNQCRIENCAGWGIDCDVTGPYNEISFIHMKHVFVQGCGTASMTVPPPSGGMRWKGQIVTMDSCAFVICENVGVYVQGGAGLANTVIAYGVALENNRKTGLYCDGLDSMYWIRGHVYNNDSFVATRGMEFDGATRTVKNILIDGIVVRATSGNSAIQAFTISGANAELNTCRVRNTSWQNFDHAGQVRFSGWQFDQVENDCELWALSSTAIRVRPTGRGNKIPHRLRGPGSTTGEWIQLQLGPTGVNATNSGLANSTQYYVYSYDNNGVIALELSTTASTIDSESGYSVKTGDATRLYHGLVVTDGSANFATTGTGWLNPTPVSGTQVGVPGYLWIDSTGDLRVKTTLPTSDTDGTVVGTQT